MNLYKKCLYRLPVLSEQLLFFGGFVSRENGQSGLDLGRAAVLVGEIQPGTKALEGVLK